MKQQAKLLYRYARFSDKLLRRMEVKNTGPENLIKVGLSEMGKDKNILAKAAISSGI